MNEGFVLENEVRDNGAWCAKGGIKAETDTKAETENTQKQMGGH